MSDNVDARLSLYREYIGGFVIAFEETCNRVRICITFALLGDGLRNQALARAVTADLTAGQLHNMLKGLSGIAASENNNDHLRKVMKVLLSRYQKLTEIRNEFLHSNWNFENIFVDETERIIRFKQTNAARGPRNSEKVPVKLDLSEIYYWIKEAEELSEFFLQLYAYLHDTFREINDDFSIAHHLGLEKIQQSWEKTFVFENGNLRSTLKIERRGRFVPKHEPT